MQPRLNFLAIAALLLATCNLSAQDDYRRPLEHEDYEKWSTVSGQSLSRDGNWMMYTVRLAEEKSKLHVRDANSSKQYEIQDGTSGRFTFDSQHAIFRVTPDSDLLKKLKKEKRSKETMPRAKLQILELKTGELTTVERVKSFSLPRENGDWVAIHLEKPFDDSTVRETKSEISETYENTEEGLKRPYKKKTFAAPKKEQPKSKEPETKKPAKKKGSPKGTKKKDADENEDDKKSSKKNDKKKEAGTTLIVRNLATGAEQRIQHVSRFTFSKFGKHLAYAVSTGDKGEGDGVFVMDVKKGTTTELATGLGNYKDLTFSVDEKQFAFATDKDDYESKKSSSSIYHWKVGQKKANLIADADTDGILDSWWIAPRGGLVFSEDLKRLYFETMPMPEDLDDEDEEDEDKDPVAELDLWHWKDPQLQPQQLLQANADRNRSYRAAFDLKKKKVVQLATIEMPSVSIDMKSKADHALAVSNWKYRKAISWDYPGFQDTYLVDLKTGESRILIERGRTGGSLSPDGKWVTWWDPEEEDYFVISTKPDAKPRKLTGGIKPSLANELHDTPSPVNSYRSAGWVPDESAFLVYDRYDMWQVDPTGKQKPICVTKGKGREMNVRLRHVETDPEARHVDLAKPAMISAFNETTKASGYYRLAPPAMKGGDKKAADKKAADKKAADKKQNAKKKNAKDKDQMAQKKIDPKKLKLEQLIMLDESVGRITKARDADTIVFSRSTFQKFPDLWQSTVDFKKLSRISDANPQQSDYLWGSNELVHWDATDGQKLDGILYKPDNFDPKKKYPLMVYFYERNSDNLHRHYVPAAGRSIINYSFYVSRGYVVFVPDIPYKTGEPGPSAANAILPGVESIVELGFIDKERIGMQGHSWGGYQTAYLVTQTDMFACAESGAPVSNMTSAYGGIRWSSGMSRMFQYERTQSRIGNDLWVAREDYIANSPVFFADKVNTPLLILHNDKDGAVPWYQGIEMFVAMRRLEKPCWLMNYNGEPHWVMKKENRLDFAIRMQQFFDHYLLDEPMPEWMANGIPAVDKGKKLGYEPAEMETEKMPESASEKKKPMTKGKPKAKKPAK